MKTIKIMNITGMALFVDGTRLLPGQEIEVSETDDIKNRIGNGFFKMVEEIKEKKVVPIKETKEKPEEVQVKKAAVMMEKKSIKPAIKINKNN